MSHRCVGTEVGLFVSMEKQKNDIIPTERLYGFCEVMPNNVIIFEANTHSAMFGTDGPAKQTTESFDKTSRDGLYSDFSRLQWLRCCSALVKNCLIHRPDAQ